MVNSQLCPGSFHNQSDPGSETRDFSSRVVMDGTILNSLCLLTHTYESIQPSLSNGTSAEFLDSWKRAIALLISVVQVLKAEFRKWRSPFKILSVDGRIWRSHFIPSEAIASPPLLVRIITTGAIALYFCPKLVCCLEALPAMPEILFGSSGFSMQTLLGLTSFQSFQPCHTAPKCLQWTFTYNIL